MPTDTTSETVTESPALTPEEIEREQIRAQYFDLFAVVNMLLKQGNAHGYFKRPDEVALYRKFREEMAEAGTPIPDIVQDKVLTLHLQFDIPFTAELEENLGFASEGSYPNVDSDKFNAWWTQNINRDRTKLLAFLKDAKAKLNPVKARDNTTMQVKTVMGEWPDTAIAKIGEEVMNEIKAANSVREVI